jgi:cytochrome oxidase assembly protein ShyY1
MWHVLPMPCRFRIGAGNPLPSRSKSTFPTRLSVPSPNPLAFAALALTVLVALGTWQLKRRGEKRALIETLDRRLSAAPIALPARNVWPQLDEA